MRQYVYFCTTKASKLGTGHAERKHAENVAHELAGGEVVLSNRGQYVYFCTTKASKLGTGHAERKHAENVAHELAGGEVVLSNGGQVVYESVMPAAGRDVHACVEGDEHV